MEEESKAHKRFVASLEDAKKSFPNNIIQLPSHREGYISVVLKLDGKTTTFEFPPQYPFRPPRVWTATHELKISMDFWTPVYVKFMPLAALVQDVFAGTREMDGWTVVKKLSCAVCSEIGAKKCSGCYDALYCSKVCQKADWEKAHKLVCSE